MVIRDVESSFDSVVKHSLEYREKNNIFRKDFFQLLIQVCNTGTVQADDDQWKTMDKSDENSKTMTLNEICAHVYIFFAAKNFEIQEKVHNEIV